MTKEERIREVYANRGRPDFYRDYRWKSSFTQSVNTDLEKAIAEDNHGAFRIQIMKLNIPWRMRQVFSECGMGLDKFFNIG